MQAGQFSLSLDPTTPKSVLDLLLNFGHIFTFDASRVRSGLSDATMITLSRWGGQVRLKSGGTIGGQRQPWTITGANQIVWLGDEDGKGSILTGALTTPNTFVGYINAALVTCVAVTAGTLTAIAGSKTITYNHMTVRAVLDHLCTIYNAEYRVNKDATIDAGPSTTVFPTGTTPTAIAVMRSSGRDLNITGISVTQLDIETDAEEYINRALTHDVGGYSGSATASDAYVDLHGHAVKMWKIFEEPTTPAAEANTQATNLLATGNVLRNQVTLATDEFDVTRDVNAGDTIWLYDVDGNMVDMTGPGVRYRGSILHPVKIRVMAVTWPIEQGMSVWYRSGAAVWTDLTNYVAFEPPGATLEVGAPIRPLVKFANAKP